MRAGKLDRLIDIQRGTATSSPSGAQVFTWNNLVSRWPAGLERRRDPIETAQNLQVMASDQVEFRIRYSSEVADLSPIDRIIYPALTPPADPAPREIYNIISVSEIGRREGLRIVAWCHADASASAASLAATVAETG